MAELVTLRFSSVSREFGEDPPIVALRHVDLEIHEGDFIALEGPSGSGKSTLLNLIALIDTPSAGSYSIGADATNIPESRRARLRSELFGFVFQSFHLMPRRSAIENVELGLLYRGIDRTHRRELARAQLAKVGLADRADVAAAKLSGGERQRVAIARATVGGAPFLLADEPTGNLDTATGLAILDQLIELNSAGTTVVMVTHDPDVAARAVRRLHMRDGLLETESRGRFRSDAPTEDERNVSTSGSRPVPGNASRLRALDLAHESWQGLGTRPGRTALLIAGVGFAVALITITLGLAQAASSQVSNSFDVRRNREVTVTLPKSEVSQDGYKIPRDPEERLSQVRGIVSAGLLEQLDDVRVSVPDESPVDQIPLNAGSEHLVRALGAKVAWAPGHPHTLGRHEVVVGSSLADDLQLGPLELDPVLEIGGTTYRAVGILQDGGRAPAMPTGLLVNTQYATELAQINSATVFITTLPGAAQQVAKQAPVALDPIHADALDVSAPADPSTLRDAIQSDVKAALISLTVVAGFASILGVANAMLLSVIERIGELGLRRAIGARPIHILSQTTLESIVVGLLGGIVGFIAGLGVVLGVTIARQWQPVFDLRLAPLAVLGGALVGAVGGLPAGIRASRIQPADALRR